MRALFCDDDLRFAEQTAALVTDYYRGRGIAVTCTVCSNPEALLRLPALDSYEIAMLDADMKPISGIELGRRLKQIAPDIILVYISAFLEFALQGYTVDTFRYMLKKDLAQTLPTCLEEILNQLAPGNRYLTFKKQAETVRIPFREIYYLECELRKINVYGCDPAAPLDCFYQKLSTLAQELADKDFLQINKSDLINMAHIKSLRSYEITLTNGVAKNVSRKEYPALKNRFMEWRGNL